MTQNGNAEESISFGSNDESFDFLDDESNQNSNQKTQQPSSAVPSNINNAIQPSNASNAINNHVTVNQISNMPIGAPSAGVSKPAGINFNSAPMANPPTIPPSKPSATGSRLLLKKTINKANESSSLDISFSGSSQTKPTEPSTTVSTHINNIEELDKDPPEPPKASIPVTIKPRQTNPPPIPSIPKNQGPPSIQNQFPQAADTINSMNSNVNSIISGQSFSQGSSFELFTKMPPVPVPNQEQPLHIQTVSPQPQNPTPGKISVQIKPKILLQKQQQQQNNSSGSFEKSNIPLKKSDSNSTQPFSTSSLMNSSSDIGDSINKAFAVPLQNKYPSSQSQTQEKNQQQSTLPTQAAQQMQATQPVQQSNVQMPIEQPSQISSIEKKDPPKSTIPIKLKVRALQKASNSQLNSSMIGAPSAIQKQQASIQPVQSNQTQQQSNAVQPLAQNNQAFTQIQQPQQTQPQNFTQNKTMQNQQQQQQQPAQQIQQPTPVQQPFQQQPKTQPTQQQMQPAQQQIQQPIQQPQPQQQNQQLSPSFQQQPVQQIQQQQPVQQIQQQQQPIQQVQQQPVQQIQQQQPIQQNQQQPIQQVQQQQQPVQQIQQQQPIQQIQQQPVQQIQQQQPIQQIQQQPMQQSQFMQPSQNFAGSEMQQQFQFGQQQQSSFIQQPNQSTVNPYQQQMQFSPSQQQQQIQYGMQQPLSVSLPYQQQQQQSFSSSFQFPSPPPSSSVSPYAANTPPQVVYLSPPSSVPYRPSPTSLVEQRFANSLDRSFSSFRRFFSAEFSMMMRQPSSFSPSSVGSQNGGGFDFDEYSESLSNEVSQIIESPVTPLDINRTSLSRSIIAAIDEQTKPLTAVLNESNNRHATFAKTRLSQLKQLREELDSLFTVFKSNADSIIKELENESQNTLNMRNAQIAKQNDLEQRMRSVKLRQVELEAKATHQSVERDSLERQLKQLESRRRDWEDQNGYGGYGYNNRDNFSMISSMSRNDSFTQVQSDYDNPSNRYRSRILSEINALRKELSRDSFDEISKSIDEGLSMIRNESDNMKNELIDIDMANRWLMSQIQLYQPNAVSAASFTAKPVPLPLTMSIPVPQMQPQSQTQLQTNASLLANGFANTTTIATSPVKKTGNQPAPSSPMTKAQMKLNMFRKRREEVVREVQDDLS